MEPQTIMNEMVALISNEIPECQQNLRDNHRNLERVAEYCDTHYFRSNNMPAALEETKNYTIQSLASVAYQITSLAFNILHLLDLQATQITTLETQSSHLKQSEQILREKVARREIGLFTANKRPHRIPKILYPANPERHAKYVRKPIDYSALDDIGHGVKLAPTSQQHPGQQQHQQQQQQLLQSGSQSSQQSQMHTSRTISISSAQSINGGGAGGSQQLYAPGMSVSGLSNSSNNQAPSTKPPSPPHPARWAGSLSRTSKEYRNPGPMSIAPPQVPVDYAPDWVPKNYIEKVIALYDYTKEKPDELNLCENAIIYVTKKNEDGWYEGVLNGEEGLFPCNYVEPLRDY